MSAHSDIQLQSQGQVNCVRRNLIAHIIDGGLYMGSMLFLSATTVLPVLFEFLGAGTWLIALAPLLAMLGYMLPSIFVSHWVDRLHRVKPFTLWMGLFQRLPFVFVTIAIFMLDAQQHKEWLLYMVIAAILVSGLCGGLAMGAWQELIHRTVPAVYRAGMFASRNAMAALMGLFIGVAVEYILSTYVGMQGYGVLFLCTAVGLFLSYFAYCYIREIPDDKKITQRPLSFWQNMRDIPDIIRSQPGFFTLILVIVLGAGAMLVLPFLAIETRDRLQVGDAFVGRLLTAQMIGGLIGNLLAGYLGNRWGGRLPFILGSLLLLCNYFGLYFCETEMNFQCVFVVLGMAQFMMMVGQNTLALELAPADRRSTSLSIMRVLTVPALIIASLCAAGLREYGFQFETNVGIAIAVAVLALLLSMRVPEPRQRIA